MSFEEEFDIQRHLVRWPVGSGLFLPWPLRVFSRKYILMSLHIYICMFFFFPSPRRFLDFWDLSSPVLCLLNSRDFKKAGKTELFNEIEWKVYRKYTGKLLWLAENCRPDLAFMANQLSKKSHNATISDLKYVNKVLKKVRERDSEVVYSRVGNKEELVIRCMSDASYMKAKESVGGSLVMLGNRINTRTVPLYWKSKRITKMSTSTKDAETHALFKCVADAAFSAVNVETLLFGEDKKRSFF